MLPGFVGDHGGELRGCTASRRVVQIEPSLPPQSPKNGSFSNIRWRLSAISLREGADLESGDGSRIRKSRHWRAFLRGPGSFSLSARLAGWRRSADRTRLHANSLLTGNFTGNFAFLGL